MPNSAQIKTNSSKNWRTSCNSSWTRTHTGKQCSGLVLSCKKCKSSSKVTICCRLAARFSRQASLSLWSRFCSQCSNSYSCSLNPRALLRVKIGHFNKLLTQMMIFRMRVAVVGLMRWRSWGSSV